jgi:ABC-2 type transport system ATP-binding protein
VPAAIAACDLTRRFGAYVAVDGLTFEVAPGEVVALLGPNGAGKTTTVRLLNGVLRPDRGTCRVLGLDPTRQGEQVRARTGVLTENAGLDDRLSAFENLLFAARIRGMPAGEAARRAAAMLERFGMAERAHAPVQGLSTGQRKRVALGRALLHEPEVLFLDEPTSGLDPEASRDVLALIATLAREHGRTVVVCTHFLAEAGRLADRMAVLHRGRLRAFGRPEDLGRELWPGLGVDLDLGGPADASLLGALAAVPGVLHAATAPGGAHLRVEDREVVARVVAALVAREVAVYGAVPRPATLEDVYFALAETGDDA